MHTRLLSFAWTRDLNSIAYTNLSTNAHANHRSELPRAN